MNVTTQRRGVDLLGAKPLGLGAAQFGNLYREVSDQEVRDAFETAWEAGVRYFDTAPHYGLGLSERRLGRLLREKPRDEYVLSTKVGKLLVPNPGGETEQDDQGFAVPADVRRQWDFSAAGVVRSLEASLDRLGVDRVDIVYVHDPDDFGDQVVAEAIPALIELRDRGVVGAIGTGMNQSALPARFVSETDIDLVMLAGRFSLLDQGALDDLLPAALEKGVGIVAAGAYNSGILATDRPPRDSMYDYAQASPDLIDRAWRIADVCEAHGVRLPEAAVAFARRHPAVVSTVLGMRTARQAVENARRFDVEIPDALWSDLEAERLVRPLGLAATAGAS